jgi:hypothetical protein
MHAPPGKGLSRDCAFCELLEPEVWSDNDQLHDGQRRLSVCWPNSSSGTSNVYLELYSRGERKRIRTSLIVLPGRFFAMKHISES